MRMYVKENERMGRYVKENEGTRMYVKENEDMRIYVKENEGMGRYVNKIIAEHAQLTMHIRTDNFSPEKSAIFFYCTRLPPIQNVYSKAKLKFTFCSRLSGKMSQD